MPKRIAVIGAGGTGMTATKQCLDQGFDVVVFEKTNYTGGLWRFQESLDENGIASVMKSTIINTSKEMSAFSDFAPPAEYPNYMHNTQMVAYFDLYANSFNFTKYVRFRHEIVSLEMANDYEQTGRWQIKYRQLDQPNQPIHTEVFDGVMICTGHHGTVNEPKFPGQDQFKGTVMHTHSLKSGQGFEDKNVVVVGIGNSGGDAAVELSITAKQVYLSTRRGTWLFHRVSQNGLPLDQYLNRRIVQFIIQLLPYWLTCTLIEWYLNCYVDHEMYQLKPAHRCLSQHIMINDTLPNRLLSGRVKLKGDIDHFTEDGVVFKGENVVTPCDVVVLATGYLLHFPFLSDSILPVHNNKVRLYKYQFVHNLKHPHTLAFIGLIQPIGALLPISEMQSRLFALLNAHKLKLPSQAKMEQDMAQKEKKLQARYYQSDRHTIQTDWLPFMDELAKMIGAKPPLWLYLFTDIRLFFTLVFGVAPAYQYRLVGPNVWKNARDALLTVQDRIKAPLRTNTTKVPSVNKLTNLSCTHILVFAFGLTILITSLVSALLVKSFTTTTS